jgi:hypothetical protein
MSAEALRALQLQEVHWQVILDTARDAIIGIDPMGRVTLFKHAAEEIRSFSKQSALEKLSPSGRTCWRWALVRPAQFLMLARADRPPS